jgi:hypothetical protein
MRSLELLAGNRTHLVCHDNPDVRFLSEALDDPKLKFDHQSVLKRVSKRIHKSVHDGMTYDEIIGASVGKSKINLMYFCLATGYIPEVICGQLTDNISEMDGLRFVVDMYGSGSDTARNVLMKVHTPLDAYVEGDISDIDLPKGAEIYPTRGDCVLCAGHICTKKSRSTSHPTTVTTDDNGWIDDGPSTIY